MSESGNSRPPFRPELPTTVEEPVSLFPDGRLALAKRGVVTVIKGPQRGRFFAIPASGVTVGRSEEANIILPDPGLSRVHARLSVSAAGTYFVEDCGSTNGTFLGRARLQAAQQLSEGDLIGLGGHTVLKFAMQDPLEEQALRDVYESATRDHLTGAHNRGVFDERLASEFAFARRHLSNLALLLFDVDHFKKVNDTYGHPAGDSVLVGIAVAVQRSVRVEDLFARYGGEEFGIIARELKEPSARILGQRVRRAVSALSFPLGAGELKVTVSVGVACLSAECVFGNPAKLVEAADSALYTAKHGGRDQVVVFEPGELKTD